jgi:hypothetical protein
MIRTCYVIDIACLPIYSKSKLSKGIIQWDYIEY